MEIPFYQIDAFTSELFRGNPAAVCILDAWLDESRMQNIATENNLSETAFLVPADDGFELRWFTPTTEVALCGHATLASAFVLFELLQWSGESISFHTRNSGTLLVSRQGSRLELDFPSAPVIPIACTPGLEQALGIYSEEAYSAGEDVMVVLKEERQVRELQPDMVLLRGIECRGVIVTAPGDQSDFVSRFFCPQVGINEDPVTGSAHCALTPFWSRRLKKSELHAFQVSPRGGELFCQDRVERVRIAGNAVLYLQGTITI
ncbi:PhzF family phenazine biosynthesis protein [Candidatus Zixiibacteriota bacterium]